MQPGDSASSAVWNNASLRTFTDSSAPAQHWTRCAAGGAPFPMRYNPVPWTFGLLESGEQLRGYCLAPNRLCCSAYFVSDWRPHCFFFPSLLQPIVPAEPPKWLCLVMTKSLRFSSSLFHHIIKFTACWRALFTWRMSTRSWAQHSKCMKLAVENANSSWDLQEMMGNFALQLPLISITAAVMLSTWFITSLTVFCVSFQSKISPFFYLQTIPSPKVLALSPAH